MTDTRSNKYQQVTNDVLDILISSNVGASGTLYILFSILYGFCKAADLDFEKTCRAGAAQMVKLRDLESDVNYN